MCLSTDVKIGDQVLIEVRHQLNSLLKMLKDRQEDLRLAPGKSRNLFADISNAQPTGQQLDRFIS
jgi:hypothetical protein